ncbi:hypothetical protein DVH05_004607 [Phytophthora capsici]|nr:hypothetical protein DVH05_004607 [Phytophthora capsici]
MAGNLSEEQERRVTIGLEMVSNGILFRPKVRIHARSALFAMHAVNRTHWSYGAVHASISIFELFDGLLLLQKGVELLEHFKT